MKKLAFAMAVVAAGAATAGVSFSYQGALKTATGGKVDQLNKTISFRLYDGPTVSDALWGRKVAVRLDDDGLFNVELSDLIGGDVEGVKTNNLDWVLANYLSTEKKLYIGLYVEGSTGEIRPRQQLINVPAAAFAADVAKAKNDFTVDGIATFNGPVNALDTMTVSKKLTISSGGLTVSGGGLEVKTGGLTVSKGGLTVADGGLTVSSGSLSVPGGAIVPKGGIIMWSGNKGDIPSGWALCDGTQGTPNLCDRFIVGAGSSYGAGETGGNNSVKLEEKHIPKHAHTIYMRWRVAETEENKDPDGYDDYGWFVRDFNDHDPGTADSKYKEHDHPVTVNTATYGQGESINIRPPYYALCFIMKL